MNLPTIAMYALVQEILGPKETEYMLPFCACSHHNNAYSFMFTTEA